MNTSKALLIIMLAQSMNLFSMFITHLNYQEHIDTAEQILQEILMNERTIYRMSNQSANDDEPKKTALIKEKKIKLMKIVTDINNLKNVSKYISAEDVQRIVALETYIGQWKKYESFK